MKLFAYHGVHKAEKVNGQNFVLDITIWLDLTKPCCSDSVGDTVSYSEIIKRVTDVFVSEKYDLIERAAQVVCDAILADFPGVVECELLLKKPEAPINADFSYVAVEIRRRRDE